MFAERRRVAGSFVGINLEDVRQLGDDYVAVIRCRKRQVAEYRWVQHADDVCHCDFDDGLDIEARVELTALHSSTNSVREGFSVLGRQCCGVLPEFGVTMPFKPTDFTQVNP